MRIKARILVPHQHTGGESAFASKAPAWHSKGHIIGTYEGGAEGGHDYDTDFQAFVVTNDSVPVTWNDDLVV